MDLLLDTNILIDYLGQRKPFYKEATQLIAAGYFSDARLWTPVKSLSDVFYILQKHIDTTALQKKLAQFCKVVLPVDLTSQDALRALNLSWKDYEDCLVAVAADKVRADYLITRDKKGFIRSSVPVANPQEILKILEQEQDISYTEIPLAESEAASC